MKQGNVAVAPHAGQREPVAVFRCNAGPQIGGGHLYRCLVLADRLATDGWRCVFACNSNALKMVPAAAAATHVWHGLDEAQLGNPSDLQGASPRGCDLLVVDHYGLDADYERGCRAWAGRVLVIDDLADRPHQCNMLLDQTPGRQPADYGPLAETPCRFLLGPDYALLRPQFASARAELGDRRAERPTGVPPRLLISFGAADRQKLTLTALQAALHCSQELVIDVVVGGQAAPLAEAREIAVRQPTQVRLHVDVDDMAGLMAAADVAIGAAGTTSWERCCLGLPSIVLVAVDNQAAIGAALDRSGAAEVLGRPDTVTAAQLSNALADLLTAPDRLRRMSEAATELCDGQGASRVLDAVQQARVA